MILRQQKVAWLPFLLSIVTLINFFGFTGEHRYTEKGRVTVGWGMMRPWPPWGGHVVEHWSRGRVQKVIFRSALLPFNLILSYSVCRMIINVPDGLFCPPLSR